MGAEEIDNNAVDEVAAAEAELKAAQERLHAAQGKLEAAKARRAAASSAQPQPPDAAQDDFAQPQPSSYQAPTQQESAQPYQPPQAGAYQPPAYGQPQSQPQQPNYQQAHYGYQAYYQQPYAQPVVLSKDHVAAGLLAILLGWLGIHKFYLGYNSAGFIMLGISVLGGILTLSLASWVIWIIAIVEGIMYFTKSQTEFEQIYVLNKREWF